MLVEKINQFADGKYDVTVPPDQISTDFEAKRNNVAEAVEGLSITQRAVSTCKHTLLTICFSRAYRRLEAQPSPREYFFFKSAQRKW